VLRKLKNGDFEGQEEYQYVKMAKTTSMAQTLD